VHVLPAECALKAARGALFPCKVAVSVVLTLIAISIGIVGVFEKGCKPYICSLGSDRA
jgi:hypothetical protein